MLKSKKTIWKEIFKKQGYRCIFLENIHLYPFP